MRIFSALLLAHLFVLSACNPSVNWRLLTLDEAKIQVMLPCRFNKAKQNINIGGGSELLNVYGCKVDGELFAVSILPFAARDTYSASVDAWQLSLLQKTLQQELGDDVHDLSRNLWLELKSNQHVDFDIKSRKIQLQRNSKKASSDWENQRIDELNLSFSNKGRKLKWKGIWGVRNVEGKKYLLHAIVIGDLSSKGDLDEFFGSVIN